MILILIGLALAIIVPFIYSAYLSYRDVRRMKEHPDIWEWYEPRIAHADNSDEREMLWHCFNKECDEREHGSPFQR